MTSTAIQAIGWEVFRASLSGIEIITTPAQVAKLSEDYYSFSPVLQGRLTGKTADLVVRPASEADVLQVAAACVKFKLPLTARRPGRKLWAGYTTPGWCDFRYHPDECNSLDQARVSLCPAWGEAGNL